MIPQFLERFLTVHEITLSSSKSYTRYIAILAIRKVLELLDIGIISTKIFVSMKSSCNCLLWLKVKTTLNIA